MSDDKGVNKWDDLVILIYCFCTFYDLIHAGWLVNICIKIIANRYFIQY